MNQTSLVLPMVLLSLGRLPDIALARVDHKALLICIFLTDVSGMSYFAYQILFLSHEHTILPKLEN